LERDYGKIAVEHRKNAFAQRAVWRQSGCGSYDTLQDFGSLALVRASPIPRPTAKPPPRWAQSNGFVTGDKEQVFLEFL